MWTAIEWRAQKGYATLSLGRTDAGNEGMNRFTSQWGATEWVILYFAYDLSVGAFVQKARKVTERQTRLLKELPQGLLRATGGFLYRHIA